MMGTLETILKGREIDFDANDCQIMCFAHVVNLCSGRVIHGAAGDSGDTPSESGVDITPSNPIARAHAAVQVIRASSARRDAFLKVIKNGNEGGWFRSGDLPEVVQLKPLQLLRDVRTRWDSVYYMLRRLHKMRLVCLLSSNAMPAN